VDLLVELTKVISSFVMFEANALTNVNTGKILKQALGTLYFIVSMLLMLHVLTIVITVNYA